MSHPRLGALVLRARDRAATGLRARLGFVYPCDRLALEAAAAIEASGIAVPLMIGPRHAIERAADTSGIDIRRFEIIATEDAPRDAARRATRLAADGALTALMKGALHTDELLSEVIRRDGGLRTGRRISHLFVFDLPRYPKLLALSDCVVNIAPDLATKREILDNALHALRALGVVSPKVAIVASAEKVNAAIPATVDARSLAQFARAGVWPDAVIEGPLGFDNAISAQAAHVKKIRSRVAGDADLLLMPDVNAGNMLYKSFTYIGGGDCAGMVIGARVPVVLTSRADSLAARVASAALAVLAGSSTPEGELHAGGATRRPAERP